MPASAEFVTNPESRLLRMQMIAKGLDINRNRNDSLFVRETGIGNYVWHKEGHTPSQTDTQTQAHRRELTIIDTG